MKILFITHEASRTGAPIILLYFLKWLKANHPYHSLHVLLGRGGVLQTDFEAIAPVWIWNDKLSVGQRVWNKLSKGSSQLTYGQRQIVRAVQRFQPNLVYGNTVLSAPLIKALSLQVPTVLHIHELSYIMSYYGNSKALPSVLQKADRVIAVSRLVHQYLKNERGVAENRLRLVHEFALPDKKSITNSLTVLDKKIPKDAFVVGACGTINWRKGTDLFVRVANYILQQHTNEPIYFVWLGGNLKHKNYYEIQYDIDKLGWTNRILFVGSHPNPKDYFARFDIFLMTSREDPFPLVCLENAEMGNPIICFEDAVGSEEFINEQTGAKVPYFDTEAMAESVMQFYQYPNKREQAGEMIRQAVVPYTIEEIAPKLLGVIQELEEEVAV